MNKPANCSECDYYTNGDMFNHGCALSDEIDYEFSNGKRHKDCPLDKKLKSRRSNEHSNN